MTPTVNISPVVYGGIREAFSNTQGKEERCGILFGTFKDNTFIIAEWAEVPNRSDAPTQTFQITAGDVKKELLHRMESGGWGVLIGSVHTHNRGTGADPSYEDVVNCPPGKIGMVYHVTTGKLTWYDEYNGFLGSM